MTGREQAMAGPQRMVRVVLALSLAGVWFFDFMAYHAMHLANADAWMAVVRGTADAPMQYRVGVVGFAWWLTEHLGLGMHYWLAAVDGVCLLVMGMALLRVLERTEMYQRASVAMQWFGAAALVVLIQFDLTWLQYLARPETLASAMLVALALWLWQMDEGPRWVVVAGMLGLAVMQAFVRADVACLMNLGVFATTISPLGARLRLGRTLAAGTSLVAALLAAGVQVWLAKMVYPQASYGHVKLWQLLPNMRHATRWPAFVLVMLPVIWMAVQVVRRRFDGDVAGVAMLAGAGLYALVWVTVGKIDEVRIFLPFALALTPLIVQMAMLRVSGE